MIPVPPPLQRLADEVDGWLDLRCPERALEQLQPLLDDKQARPAALTMRIRAHVRLGEYPNALPDLEELRRNGQLLDWVDLTEAWCRRRFPDLPGAIGCLERMLQRNPKSDVGHFNLGCYLALTGDQDRAMDAVTIACGLSETFRDLARDEPDLDALRSDPRFRQLVRDFGDRPDTGPDQGPCIGDDEPEDGDEPQKPGLN